MLNGWEILAILSVLLILFGAKHLPALARGLSKGIGHSFDDDNNGGGPLAA